MFDKILANFFETFVTRKSYGSFKVMSGNFVMIYVYENNNIHLRLRRRLSHPPIPYFQGSRLCWCIFILHFFLVFRGHQQRSRGACYSCGSTSHFASDPGCPLKSLRGNLQPRRAQYNQHGGAVVPRNAVKQSQQ